MGLSSFNLKWFCYSKMHGLSVYMKERLPFAQDLLLEHSQDFCLCFRLTSLQSASCFFFPCRSLSTSLYTVFGAISSDIDEALQINLSVNVFVFGNFNVHHTDWLTYSGQTDGPAELCYNFSISNYLTQILTFLLGTLIVTHTVLFFWIYFFWHWYFVLQWLSLH